MRNVLFLGAALGLALAGCAGFGDGTTYVAPGARDVDGSATAAGRFVRADGRDGVYVDNSLGFQRIQRMPGR